MEEKPHKIQFPFEIQLQTDPLNNKTNLQQQRADEYSLESPPVQNFKDYIQNFDITLSKVNTNQLQQLKKKYRFYLSKVQKLQQTRINLQQKYESIEDIVQNSQPVKEEKESISFIMTISEEANHKLEELNGKVEKVKQLKRIFIKQIQQLKQILKAEKSKFFEAKRAETDIKKNIMAEEKANRLQAASCTFKNIVNEKINKKKQKIQSMKDGVLSQKLVLGTTRMNSFQVLRAPTNLNQSKIDENRLPNITHHERAYTYFQNRGKEDFECEPIEQQYIITVPKLQKKPSKTSSFEEYTLDQEMSIKTNKHLFKTKSKLIANELKEMDKLKQEFLKQNTSHNKKQEHLCAPWAMQKNNVHFNKENKYINIEERADCFRKSNLKIKTDKPWKDCTAIGVKSNKRRISIQKFSLDNEQVEKLGYKIGKTCQNTEVSLLTKQYQLAKAKEQQMKRQVFLQLKPQQIVKKIIQKSKIAQLIKLIQHQGAYSFNKPIKIKLIR